MISIHYLHKVSRATKKPGININSSKKEIHSKTEIDKNYLV
jgi:hypothetical protein